MGLHRQVASDKTHLLTAAEYHYLPLLFFTHPLNHSCRRFPFLSFDIHFLILGRSRNLSEQDFSSVAVSVDSFRSPAEDPSLITASPIFVVCIYVSSKGDQLKLKAPFCRVFCLKAKQRKIAVLQ